jgi:hypothetical protein
MSYSDYDEAFGRKGTWYSKGILGQRIFERQIYSYKDKSAAIFSHQVAAWVTDMF